MYDIKLGFDNGRQLIVDQRSKITVAYCNHFYTADEADYNELHGKYSCIRIKAEDFSNGKGDNAVWVYVNLNPYEIRLIYQLAKTVFPLNRNMPYKKDFYHPFKGTYTSIFIEHSPKLNNPWVVTIAQGKCDNNKKRIGEPMAKITVMYNDELFFSIWDTLYSRLRDWERYHYSLLLKNGEPKTAAVIEEYRKNSENNSNHKQQQKNKNYNRQNNSGYNVQQQKKQSDTKPVSMPSLAPPTLMEDEIPFNKMPAYGSLYKR